MTETDETDTDKAVLEFLDRMEKVEWFSEIGWDDLERLIALARRGAAVPDEPSDEMIEAGMSKTGIYSHESFWKVAYRAMIQAALKDTEASA